MGLALYHQVAQRIRRQIQAGTYRTGDKLPSIRKLSLQEKVSVATVQQAYNLLEDQQLIKPKLKSGYYVQPVAFQKVDEPLMSNVTSLPTPVSVHERATRVFQSCEAPGIVKFGIAFPAAEFLPVRQMQRITSRLVRQKMPELLTAYFSPGSRQFRHHIARRLADAGCNLNEDEIITTNGCQEALALSLRAVAHPGDTIAIESPTFVGLLQLIEALGMKALEIPTHPQDGISLGALEMALDQWSIRACALVPAFNNPLGSNMPEENKRRLVEMLARRNVPLIEDDLFGDLNFSGSRVKAAKAFDEKGLVLYCSSVSKSVAPGFRVGWVAPGQFRGEVEYLKSFTSVGVPGITQLSISEFISTGAYDRHLRHLQTVFKHQVETLSVEISRHFPQGTTVTRPGGGYVLWIGLPANVDSMALHEKALEHKIGIVPGHLFSATHKFDNFFRLNCAIRWDDQAQRGLVILAKLASEMAEKDPKSPK